MRFTNVEGFRASWMQVNAINSGKLDYTGCPENNDFYYEGVLTSPLYPNNYPPNTECYYYMTAAPGKVLSFNFTHYDLESCCDYVTIYDGNGIKSPKLAQWVFILLRSSIAVFVSE
ncbi:CUB domain protein [Oesophagostomum dentatum]|uniref:CUB domain protein n=1 Tax=Oesophagostomum dentatum TaxID=61180 RepID=A0A0B1SLP9_OESDE|nr:CUB domain protein [Oesophagostomum dentatum]